MVAVRDFGRNMKLKENPSEDNDRPSEDNDRFKNELLRDYDEDDDKDKDDEHKLWRHKYITFDDNIWH